VAPTGPQRRGLRHAAHGLTGRHREDIKEQTVKNIAFIGLGNMGGPMAANLVRAGYTVRGVDVVEQAQAAAREQGVEVVPTAAEAARGADVVITMLPTGELVRRVIEEVLQGGVEKPLLFIDSSTVSVAECRDNAAVVRAAGHRFIDAPVSGGTVGAQAGTLAFMVGGSAEDVAEAAPLLDVMGRVTTHCGEVGAGEAAKLCNNMVLGVHQIVIAEAMILGRRLGLDARTLHDVMAGSTGASWALTTNCPVPGVVESAASTRDFAGGFGTELIIKDLHLAQASATDTGTPTPLGDLAAALFRESAAAGHGRRDFSAVIELLESQSR